MYTDEISNLSHFRVFGCEIYSKDSHERRFKLDSDVNQGVYLCHSETPKIIYYRDDKTGTFKTIPHVVYDEAHITLAR